MCQFSTHYREAVGRYSVKTDTVNEAECSLLGAVVTWWLSDRNQERHIATSKRKLTVFKLEADGSVVRKK